MDTKALDQRRAQEERSLRILVVASSLPYPPNNGTRNRTWNLIRGLANKDHVTLVTWISESTDPSWVREVRGSVSSLIVIERKPSKRFILARIVRRLQAMITLRPPYLLELMETSRVPSVEGHFDFALAMDDSALLLMPEVNCPVAVDRHNVFTRTIEDLRKSGSLGLFRRLKWMSELPIWRRYDRALCARADLAIVNTKEAAAELAPFAGAVPIRVVPNGVGAQSLPILPGSVPVVVFLGQMNYEPNVDAMISFIKGPWMRIRSLVPEATLRVVGRDPVRKLKKLRAPGVEIVGAVDDVRVACEGAWLGIAPLRAGSGIKTKTLEMMSMGLAVVATKHGSEGIDTGSDQGLLQVDSDQDLIEKTASILRNRELAVDYGGCARRFARRLPSWDKTSAQYAEIIRNVVKSKQDFSSGLKSPSKRLSVVDGQRRAIPLLYVNGTGERAGAERMLIHLMTHLDRDCFKPHVAFLDDGPFVDEVRALGVPVTVLSKAPRLRHLRGWKGTIEEIRQVIRAVGAEIVHANGEKVAIFCGRAARIEGIPCIAWLHDAPDAGGLPGRIAQMTLASTNITRIVTCASWLEKAFNRKLGVGATAIPNCIDLNDLPGPNTSVRRIAESAGWPSGSIVISHFARLQRWKGTDVFLKAAAKLAIAHDNLRFLVVGDALFGRELTYARRLRDKTEKLGLGDRLIFTGFRDDSLELMAASDVVVHCSVEADPFPLVVLEGMALGRAVIATLTKGPEEALENRRTGLLVPPGDVSALVRAIAELAGSSFLRRRIGQEARRVALRRFAAPVMAAKFEELYLTLVRQAEAPATSIALNTRLSLLTVHQESQA